MSDPLHHLLLACHHPEHTSHRSTFEACLGATVFAGLLVLVFAALSAFDSRALPFLGCAAVGAVLGTALTLGERARVEATRSRIYELTPHHLLTGDRSVPIEAITRVQVHGRSPWLTITTPDDTIELPPHHRVDPGELERFATAIAHRIEVRDEAEDRPAERDAVLRLR